MGIKQKIEALEKKLNVEEIGVFHSLNYKNQAEFTKAIREFEASNPEGEVRIFTHTANYEDEEAGEIIQETMFDTGSYHNDNRLSDNELDKGYKEVFGEEMN